MAKDIHFKKVAIIGVGLIGGSLALVLKRKKLADAITGIGRGRENLETAHSLGMVDSITQDMAEGVKGADLVVVAVPVQKITGTVKKALPYLRPPCVITDVGSVKLAFIGEIESVLPAGVSFVPGHPIAGTENSGARFAFPSLFEDRVCILTPTDKTPREALLTIKTLWQEAGARVVVMDAAAHDRILSAVSHLPHMIAYTLVNTVALCDTPEGDILTYSAGGFRDFTRIASSSPEMWADVCAMNKENIVGMIERFQASLESLKKLIEKGDVPAIKENFEKAKRIRDSLVQKR